MIMSEAEMKKIIDNYSETISINNISKKKKRFNQKVKFLK